MRFLDPHLCFTVLNLCWYLLYRMPQQCLKSIEPPLSSQVDRLMRSSLSKQSKLCWTEPQNGVARSRVQVKFDNAYNNS